MIHMHNWLFVLHSSLTLPPLHCCFCCCCSSGKKESKKGKGKDEVKKRLKAACAVAAEKKKAAKAALEEVLALISRQEEEGGGPTDAALADKTKVGVLLLHAWIGMPKHVLPMFPTSAIYSANCCCSCCSFN